MATANAEDTNKKIAILGSIKMKNLYIKNRMHQIVVDQGIDGSNKSQIQGEYPINGLRFQIRLTYFLVGFHKPIFQQPT